MKIRVQYRVRAMIALLLLIPAVGAVLGLRFKMFVLAPAMLLVSAATVAFGIASKPRRPLYLAHGICWSGFAPNRLFRWVCFACIFDL